ncbi:MAG: PQQ-binding-like beta-propeller repeat protein [Clostridiales bacterium]|nr:PQQ-binding-like beta-propeller repeat protein [Clostridiales bacterium]
MKHGDQYIEPNNNFYRPSRDPNEGTMTLVVVITLLFVCLTGVLAAVYFKKATAKETLANVDTTDQSGYISVASPTPTPIPPITDYQNPILYPGMASVNINKELAIAKDCVPSARRINQTVMVNRTIVEGEYNREKPIYMTDPVFYGSVPGIFTYRGNNFRNCASFGYTNLYRGALTQRWEFNEVGKLLASTLNFEWSGVRWTGQPLVVEWPAATRQNMDMFDSAKQQLTLTEVIVAALDGKVYFFNLQNGEPTREPIDVGASIKGTPALDPRGYPLLYVGQTDNNGGDIFGMYIYSLLDGSLLYSYDGSDDGAYRSNWNAFDSSPIINAETDTLIWPCENGIIYTFDLNTAYTGSSIHVSPVVTGYKYMFDDNIGSHMGVESSIAVYGNYGYFMDNTMNLCCLDLNTLQMVWTKVLGDDSDVTPVIDEEDGIPYVYIGTEVDNQGGTGEYCGAAYIYKINGLTGETVWQSSEPCYTFNGESSDSDQSGGCFGNPIIGKGKISNLVIFSFSMTNALASGNKLVAYDKDLGTVVWEYNMNIYSYSSPVDFYDSEGNAYIVICDSIGQVHLIDACAIDAKDLRITYIQTKRNLGQEDETSSGICIEASPVIYKGMLVVGTTSGSIFGIAVE